MARLDPATFATRARALRLLLFDVDGVLTDGGVYMDGRGRELKRFHIRDGAGLAVARHAGLLTGVISARASHATATRAAELKMAVVKQGVADKRVALAEILAEHGLTADQVAFMGDDLVDLSALAFAGLAAAPADAAAEVLAAAGWIATRPGGQGAVREFIEAVLSARGQWDDVVTRFR